jgi:hypothetical protein
MSRRERFFLALSVIGFVVPNVMLAVSFSESGMTTARYFGDWFGTLPSAQLFADLAICCLALFVWAAWEGRGGRIPGWWLVFPATALVGLCFALPGFLFLRERAERNRTVASSAKP